MNGKRTASSLAARLAIGLIVCVTLSGPRLATAQGYRELEPDPEVVSLASAIRIAKGRILNGQVQLSDRIPPGDPLDNFATYEEVIDAWYVRYRLPLFTQARTEEEDVTQAKREDAATLRSNFNRDLRSCRSTSAHEHIAAKLQETMVAICRNDFHPAVRYNAMLMLGELNSTEAVRVGQNQAPPVPLLPALISMLDEFESEEQVDAVRVAAMIGILRHVEMAPFRPAAQPLPPSLTPRIIEPMLELVQADTPPEGRSLEGHGWMQRQAIEILGAFGKGGENGIVLTALATKLSDDSLSIPIRCAVVQALANFEPGLAGNLDPTRILGQAGRVGIDSVQDELSRIQNWEDSRDQNREGFDGGVPGRGRFDEDAIWDAEVELQITSLRRRLKVRLACVHQGIVGPPGIAALAVTPDQQNLAEDLVLDLEKALAALDEKPDEEILTTSMEKLDLIRDSLQQAGRSLEATVNEALASVDPSTGPAQPEPPEDDPAEPDDGLPGGDLPG